MCFVLMLHPFSNCIMYSWKPGKNVRVDIIKKITEFVSFDKPEGLRISGNKPIAIRIDF